jgi:hypothetical protein
VHQEIKENLATTNVRRATRVGVSSGPMFREGVSGSAPGIGKADHCRGLNSPTMVTVCPLLLRDHSGLVALDDYPGGRLGARTVLSVALFFNFAIPATGDGGTAAHATLAGRGLGACNESGKRSELFGDHLFGWLVLEHTAFELGLSKPDEHFRRSEDGCIGDVSAIRRWYCMRAPPIGPPVADWIATGLSLNGWFSSLDTQSSAFFNPPGIVQLYSGLTIITPSALRDRIGER